MSETAPRLDPARRAELTRLLEERARLLAPSPELVHLAIARCVRHDLRQQREEQAREDEVRAEEPASTRTPLSSATEAASAATVASSAPARTEADPPAGEPVSIGDHVPRGRVIAGYRIESMLGKGGMGQVYRATQLSVQREVAFKVLAPRLAADRTFRERFLREARAAGRLHHPNMIGVHDVGEAGGMMFFSMELVEGRTVKDLIGESGTLPLERALDVAAQALTALQYAHERGVVHRDIKPDNIMVTAAGLVKVADLGLSRIELAPDETGSDATQAGTIMGTPHYMSPEQGRDAHAADHRSDLYSLGATLYHMLCGRPPFTGASPVDVVMKAATQPLAFPEPGPPTAARALIAKLMAKKPEERPASAAEALALLERVRQGGSIEHSRRSPRVAHIRRRRLRRLLPMLSAIVAAAIALAVLAAIARRHADEQAWTRDQNRVEAAVGQGEWRRALELAQAQLQEQEPASARARQAEALRDDVQRRWDAWSAEGVRAPLAAADKAIAEKRWADADKALRFEDEESLAPPARQQIDARREQIERVVDELLEKPPVAPGDELARLAEASRRQRELRFAPMVWGRFTWNPATAAVHDETGMVLTGAGSGTLPFPQLPRPLRPNSEVRLIELHLRLAAPPAGDERWALALGRAKLELSSSGVVATAADGTVQTLAPGAKAEATLRLRRAGDGVQASAKENTWFTLGPLGGDAAMSLSWRLAKDHALSVAVVPQFERLVK